MLSSRQSGSKRLPVMRLLVSGFWFLVSGFWFSVGSALVRLGAFLFESP